MSWQDMDAPRSWPPDRSERPPLLPGSGKLAWRVLWVTTAFLAVVIVTAQIASGVILTTENISEELSTLAFILGILIPNYWCAFALIFFSRTDVQNRNWRVWSAWMCITGPIIWYWVDIGRGADPTGWGLAVFLLLGPTLLSPIGTIIGALAGGLLFRFYMSAKGQKRTRC